MKPASLAILLPRPTQTGTADMRARTDGRRRLTPAPAPSGARNPQARALAALVAGLANRMRYRP